MKRRLAAGLAIGVAALGALTACGSSGSSNGNITLKFFGADYGDGPANSTTKYWNDIASAFHKANPKITVQVTTIDWTDYPNKVKTIDSSKQFPDIMEGTPPQEYAASDLLYKASDIVSPATLNNIIPHFMQDENYKGTPYGLPFTTSTRALFYNKKIFAAAGITTPPTTWAQLQSDAAAIKAKGFIGYGMPLGPEEPQAESLLWFLGNGGGYVDSSGKYDINSAQNIQTMDFMKGMSQAGDTQPSPGTTDRKDVWTGFAQDKIGMVLGSTAVIPEIESAGKLQPSDYGSAIIPGKNGPITSTIGVHDDIVAFNTNGNHKDAIKSFLDFVYQDQYQTSFHNEYKLLPATNSATAPLESDPVYGPFVKNIPTSVTYPTNSNWDAVNNQIKQIMGQAISGDPKSVLNQIQQTATSGS